MLDVTIQLLKHALGEKRISTGEEVEASAMEDEGGSRLMTTDHT